ncbi:MAG: hypothetical protein GF320_23050 [Armatimonadia bacterium]|nr:hypothetical protein [Armatimonadia bacterium]
MIARLLALCVIATLSLVPTVVAQEEEPEAAVEAAVEEFLAAVAARNINQLAARMHDPFVAIAGDMDILDREGYLDRDVQAMPPGIDFDDPELWIESGAAYALVPVTFGGGQPGIPPGFSVHIAMFLLETDEPAWEVFAVTPIFELDSEAEGAGPFGEVLAQQGEALGTFMGELMEAGESGDPQVFFDLAHDDGVFAGPYGPQGGMVASSVTQIRGMLEGVDQGPTMDVDEENADELMVGNVQTILIATTVDVTFPGQEPAPHREIAILNFDEAAGEWKMLAGLEVPLEE